MATDGVGSSGGIWCSRQWWSTVSAALAAAGVHDGFCGGRAECPPRWCRTSLSADAVGRGGFVRRRWRFWDPIEKATGRSTTSCTALHAHEAAMVEWKKNSQAPSVSRHTAGIGKRACQAKGWLTRSSVGYKRTRRSRIPSYPYFASHLGSTTCQLPSPPLSCAPFPSPLLLTGGRPP